MKPANLLVTPDGAGEDHRLRHRPGHRLGRSTPRPVRSSAPRTTSPPSRRAARRPRRPATSTRSAWCSSSASTAPRPFVADSPIATALAHIRDEVPPLPDTVPPALGRRRTTGAGEGPRRRATPTEPPSLPRCARPAVRRGAAVPPPAPTQVMPAVVPAAARSGHARDRTGRRAGVTGHHDRGAQPRGRCTPPRRSSSWSSCALLIAHPWTDDTSVRRLDPPGQDTVRGPRGRLHRRPGRSRSRTRWPTRA